MRAPLERLDTDTLFGSKGVKLGFGTEPRF
jgi:hypothetical protein